MKTEKKGSGKSRFLFKNKKHFRRFKALQERLRGYIAALEEKEQQEVINDFFLISDPKEYTDEIYEFTMENGYKKEEIEWYKKHIREVKGKNETN